MANSIVQHSLTLGKNAFIELEMTGIPKTAGGQIHRVDIHISTEAGTYTVVRSSTRYTSEQVYL